MVPLRVCLRMASGDVPAVVQLVVGYARCVDGRYEATGSVTLVKDGELRILVDCGDPWNGSEIRRKLEEQGLTPEEITHVVVTHGHVDHCGNLAMFQKAQVFMALDFVGPDGAYDSITRETGRSLSKNTEISVMEGHTSCDLVVVVRDTLDGMVVVAGDLFECEDDQDSWQAVSGYPEQQKASRRRVLAIADFIVPGHGPIFKVNKNKV